MTGQEGAHQQCSRTQAAGTRHAMIHCDKGRAVDGCSSGLK